VSVPRKRKDQYGNEYRRVRDAKGKTRFVMEGADIETEIKAANEKWHYSPALGARIALEYMEGKSVATIAKEIGYPAKTVYGWMRSRADFREQMKGARESRGFAFEEKALQAADETTGESSEEVAAMRLKVDTYKWAAEVNNRETFGRQVKSVGEAGPAIIIIQTGISREGDEPAAIPVTGTRLESEG
jgi:hypothetical protein